MTTGISSKAMLVSLSISQWSARKYDKQISAKVANDYATTTDAGRYNKCLLGNDALREITRASGDARTYHYANTLPWTDDGARILPAAHYLAYTQKMQEFRLRFEDAVNSFVSNYPALMDEAKFALNGMFASADYPLPMDISQRFNLAVTVMPIPTSADFRVDLQQSDVDAIRQDIEERFAQAQAAAQRDPWDRLHASVSHMAERLSDNKAIFRDSLTENLAEICNLLPALNVFGDPDLERMREEVQEKLCTTSAQTLRTYPGARQRTATAATELLDRMSAYTG